MSNTKSQLFSKRGCVAGFTAGGQEVSGCYLAKSKSWKVWIGTATLIGNNCRTFGSAAEADAYAITLIDTAKTAELKWWK